MKLNSLILAMLIAAACNGEIKDHDRYTNQQPVSSKALPGPIGRLGRQLERDPLWDNGPWHIVKLPSTATPEELARTFLNTQGDSLKRYRIQHFAKVIISHSTYTAVFVETNIGYKVLLFENLKEGRWMARIYNAP